MEILGTQPLSSVDIKALIILCQKKEVDADLDHLINLKLILIKGDCIELNFEKIEKRYPWILEEKAQDIILGKIRADSKFELEETAQYVLYLICKYKSKSQPDIIKMTGKRGDQFQRLRKILEDLGLIAIKNNGRKNFIIPTFLEKECLETDIITEKPEQQEEVESVSSRKQEEVVPDCSKMKGEREIKIKEVETRMYKDGLAPMFKSVMRILLGSSSLEMNKEVLMAKSKLAPARFSACIHSIKEQNYITINRRIGNNVTVK